MKLSPEMCGLLNAAQIFWEVDRDNTLTSDDGMRATHVYAEALELETLKTRDLLDQLVGEGLMIEHHDYPGNWRLSEKAQNLYDEDPELVYHYEMASEPVTSHPKVKIAFDVEHMLEMQRVLDMAYLARVSDVIGIKEDGDINLSPGLRVKRYYLADSQEEAFTAAVQKLVDLELMDQYENSPMWKVTDDGVRVAKMLAEQKAQRSKRKTQIVLDTVGAALNGDDIELDFNGDQVQFLTRLYKQWQHDQGEGHDYPGAMDIDDFKDLPNSLSSCGKLELLKMIQPIEKGEDAFILTEYGRLTIETIISAVKMEQAAKEAAQEPSIKYGDYKQSKRDAEAIVWGLDGEPIKILPKRVEVSNQHDLTLHFQQIAIKEGNESRFPWLFNGWMCNTCGWIAKTNEMYPPAHICPEDGQRQAAEQTAKTEIGFAAGSNGWRMVINQQREEKRRTELQEAARIERTEAAKREAFEALANDTLCRVFGLLEEEVKAGQFQADGFIITLTSCREGNPISLYSYVYRNFTLELKYRHYSKTIEGVHNFVRLNAEGKEIPGPQKQENIHTGAAIADALDELIESARNPF